MISYRAVISAFVVGFIMTLLWERSSIVVREQSSAEIVKAFEDSEESLQPLSEVIGTGLDKPAPRSLPPRGPDDVQGLFQRRNEETTTATPQLPPPQPSTIKTLMSSVFGGSDSAKNNNAPVVTGEGSKFESASGGDEGGDPSALPPIIAGHGGEQVTYTGPEMTREQCKAKYGQLKYFKQSEKRLPPMLYTFPGSGNTWGRLLIEYATGIYSGSVYNDKTLLEALPGEFTCDWSVSVIKVHPHTHNALPLLNGGFNSDNMKCKRGNVKRFQKAVLLIRDPFDSIWSEFQRRITQSHVEGIPTSYFDWYRWQANAANMASKYHEMWRAHYGAIEKQLPRENVLYLKYEDLKDKSKRVNALAGLTKFLGVESSPEHLECAFVLAENPGAHRKINAESMTKKVAYTKPVACRMWNLFGKAATRVGYSVWENMECEGFPPIHNVNVGPQGEYNSKWVKPGAKLLDFGEHPPNGQDAGKSLVKGPGYGLPSGGGTLANGMTNGPGGGLRGGGGGGMNRARGGGMGAGGGKRGPKRKPDLGWVGDAVLVPRARQQQMQQPGGQGATPRPAALLGGGGGGGGGGVKSGEEGVVPRAGGMDIAAAQRVRGIGNAGAKGRKPAWAE